MIKIEKGRAPYIVLLFSLLLFSFFVSEYKFIFILSIPIFIISCVCLVDCIKNKNYLFLCIFGLIFEMLIVMNIWLLFGNGSETSWRIMYNDMQLSAISIKYIFQSMVIFLIIYFFSNLRSDSLGLYILDNLEIELPKINIQIFATIWAIIIFYYLMRLNTLGFRNYSGRQSALILSLFRACFLLGLILCRYYKRARIFRIESFFSFLIIINLVSDGYRYLIVEWFFSLLFLNLTKIKRMKFRYVFGLAASALIFYFGLLLIKAQFIGEGLGEQLFRHERNLFFSLNAMVKNIGNNYELTYLSTIKNLLPKAITGSSDLNTGGLLMQYIAPWIQEETGVNMGGFYLSEAFANFHIVGIYAVSLILGLLCSMIERIKFQPFISTYKKNMYVIFYIILISQSYNIVYYGSSNYIKLIVYIMLLAFAVFTPIIKTKYVVRGHY